MKYIKKFEISEFYEDKDLFNYISKVNLPKIKELVKNKPNIINIKFKSGDTPLIYSIKNGMFHIFKYLIESGSDVNIPDFYEHTPLMISVRNRFESMVTELLKYNVDINAKNSDGETALILCSHYRDNKSFNILNKLIENGANWHITDNLNNTFMTYLTPIFKKEIIEKYPEKYSEYLIVQTTNKFNL